MSKTGKSISPVFMSLYAIGTQQALKPKEFEKQLLNYAGEDIPTHRAGIQNYSIHSSGNKIIFNPDKCDLFVPHSIVFHSIQPGFRFEEAWINIGGNAVFRLDKYYYQTHQDKIRCIQGKDGPGTFDMIFDLPKFESNLAIFFNGLLLRGIECDITFRCAGDFKGARLMASDIFIDTDERHKISKVKRYELATTTWQTQVLDTSNTTHRVCLNHLTNGFFLSGIGIDELEMVRIGINGRYIIDWDVVDIRQYAVGEDGKKSTYLPLSHIRKQTSPYQFKHGTNLSRIDNVTLEYRVKSEVDLASRDVAICTDSGNLVIFSEDKGVYVAYLTQKTYVVPKITMPQPSAPPMTPRQKRERVKTMKEKAKELIRAKTREMVQAMKEAKEESVGEGESESESEGETEEIPEPPIIL